MRNLTMQSLSIHSAILFLTFILFTGCGGGSGTTQASEQDESTQNAIRIIYTYTQNKDHVPTVADYIEAGIIGVNDENIDQVNALVAERTKEEVDTKEEIQKLVDTLLYMNPPEQDPVIHITEDYQVESLEKNTKINTVISIDTQKPKSLYLLFTNKNTSLQSSFSITHTAKQLKETKRFSVPTISHSPIVPHPDHITAFNSHIIQASPTSENSKILEIKKSIAEGESQKFYLEAYASDDTTTEATLRKSVVDIETEFGAKTLNIWVSNDSFNSGSGCSKVKCVTQEMIDDLADTFLRSGTNNDIYDWVTNIFGEEWGEEARQKYGSLIGESNEINILLTDIDNDNSTSGGVVGYFYSKDNYVTSTISGSNEKIMFYADAVLFATGDGIWDIDDFWPKEMVSTLAHEFQHMIHFYQKTILLAGQGTDAWLNEMLSETTEEVISTKIRHNGPRGIDYHDGSAGPQGNTQGRYPDFNRNNTLSLTGWSGTLADYSKVNAFGAYLTRNYGVEILHDIVHNPYTNEYAVENAIKNTPQGTDNTFSDLIKEWGIAVMLSDHTNLQNTPIYNSGDFILDRYHNSIYQLGSINFFNYSPRPTIYTTTGSVAPQGNYYYKIGENLSGTVDVNITLNGTTEATLIAK